MSYTGPAGRLTSRQAAVVRLIRENLTTTQIAATLGVETAVVAHDISVIAARIAARHALQETHR